MLSTLEVSRVDIEPLMEDHPTVTDIDPPTETEEHPHHPIKMVTELPTVTDIDLQLLQAQSTHSRLVEPHTENLLTAMHTPPTTSHGPTLILSQLATLAITKHQHQPT